MTEDRLENLMQITCEQDCEINSKRVLDDFSMEITQLASLKTLIYFETNYNLPFNPP
jgi:hypothetical protein